MIDQTIDGLIDASATGVALLVVALLFGSRLRFAYPLGRLIGRLSTRRPLSLLLVALWSIATAAGMALFLGLPIPQVHDEFSYLLAADTFSHGRITNPTHPMWPHFETYHVIQQPTYMSKYPPAQGLVLALGSLLGHPVYGVWIVTGLACAAVTWALAAWLPARWAVLGGLLLPLHPLVMLWTRVYWGGSVALLGSALVAGAVRRLATRARPRDGWLLLAGLVVLANSRPYEGLVVSGLAAGALLARRTGTLRPLLMPMIVGGIIAGAAMGYYNFRITGEPLRTPYLTHEEQYAVTPLFNFQELRPTPAYRHEQLRRFYVGWAGRLYERQQAFRDFAEEAMFKVLLLMRGAFRLFSPTVDGTRLRETGLMARLFSGILIVPLAALPWALRRDRWLRTAASILFLFTAALLAVPWLLTHYAAPVGVFAFVLLIASMRRLRVWKLSTQRAGLFLFRATVILWLVSFVISGQLLARATSVWARQRVALIHLLERSEGRHLLLVRYSPYHHVHDEYVFNEAGIDQARIVWAREMNPPENRRLTDYFSGRSVWLLDADAIPPRLIPLSGSPSEQRNIHQVDAVWPVAP